MAQAMNKANKKTVPVSTPEVSHSYGDDEDGFGLIRWSGEVDRWGMRQKDVIFGHETYADGCCGIVEYFNFTIREKLFEGEEKECLDALTEQLRYQARQCAFIHLTLSRRKTVKAEQPEWFVQFLNNWPQATFSDWRVNPNTGNSLQFWLLPV